MLQKSALRGQKKHLTVSGTLAIDLSDPVDWASFPQITSDPIRFASGEFGGRLNTYDSIVMFF